MNAFGKLQVPPMPQVVVKTQPMDVDLPLTGPLPTHNWKSSDKWTEHIEEFLRGAGLVRALRGLQEDLMVLPPESEASLVPIALNNLRIRLLDSVLKPKDSTLVLQDDPEVERLKQARVLNGEACTSKGNLTKEISTFLAENRARLNRSNRMEFLHSYQSKKERFALDPELSMDDDEQLMTTCARTDAKQQNRDVQMKFDITQNEDGPLRRTMRAEEFVQGSSARPVALQKGVSLSEPSLARHPGLTERFDNIEDHLAIKYVPAPPYSLMERIKMIEQHIIKLEKEYPPWAALHFKQPKRGWPPPPPDTKIIVPTHATSSARPDMPPPAFIPNKPQQGGTSKAAAAPPPSPAAAVNTIPRRPYARASSSLHKALMDKLHVKQAMDEMKGGPSNTSPT